MNPTDEQLLTATGAGDLDAFDELVRRHQTTAWNIACRYLGNPADAEDIVQEAFLKILAAAPRYRPSAGFRTYLYCVVSRLCLDWRRRPRPEACPATVEPADPSGTPDDRLAGGERQRRLREGLARLPARQRLAVVLRHFEELSYAEIATAMGLSPKAVESLLARARQSLQDFIGPKI